MKVGTRQYARRQVKWIRSRLYPAVQNSWETIEKGHDNVQICYLDTTGIF